MAPPLDVKSIVQVKFPESQYFREEQIKKQIVIHHTVSGPDAVRVFEGWASNPERIATPFVIAGDGKIIQGFNSKYWAHHLGLKRTNNTVLNKASIGIEVCNWGALSMKDGKFYSAFNREVPASEVVDYGKKWRGARYFHKYSQSQIDALMSLVAYLCKKYSIPAEYNEDIWDVCPRALSGKPGVFTHVSYREDKSDMHPQAELISALQQLGK